MKALLIALFAAVSPALAVERKDPSIEHGGFYFADPPLSMSYAMSRTDAAEFALAVTTSNQVMTKNGLELATAIFVNCESGHYTAALGLHLNQNSQEAIESMAMNFCSFHKQSFSHSLW